MNAVFPNPPTPPVAPKKHTTLKVVGGVVAAFALVGIGAELNSSAPAPAGSTYTPQTPQIIPAPTYGYTPTTTTTTTAPQIAPGDFTITLKTVHKACFGSAGCNVEVQPDIAYAHSLSELDAYGSCDITYTISGGDSGDQVETATGTGNGRYRAQNSELQTSSSGIIPKASITSITCH